MAKKMTQADRIRRYLVKHPGAKATQVMKAIGQHGVTLPSVYGVMSYDVKKKNKTVKVIKRQNDTSEVQVLDGDVVRHLLKTKMLVGEVGSVNRVRVMLDVMEQLEAV